MGNRQRENQVNTKLSKQPELDLTTSGRQKTNRTQLTKFAVSKLHYAN